MSDASRCNDPKNQYTAAGVADSNGPIVAGKCGGLPTEGALVAIAVALGARAVAGWSQAEERLAKETDRVPRATIAEIRDRILAGEDPLGEAFCKLRPATDRKDQGETFTPAPNRRSHGPVGGGVVRAVRIVDPGTGSGRYLVAAGRRIPKASLLGIEVDPLPAILLAQTLPYRAWPSDRESSWTITAPCRCRVWPAKPSSSEIRRKFGIICSARDGRRG